MPKILAVVVTYNAQKWVKKCFRSLTSSSLPVDVLVVDNGSSDETLPMIRADYPDVRIIETGENLGFGAANNIGLRIVLDEGYDFAYLINQDAWLEHDTLARLLEAYKPGWGILSPMQLGAYGRRDHRFNQKCGPYIDAALRRHYSKTLVVEVPFVMAAHWLVSREAIETVGGFSPAFKQYGEDDNWIDRLHYHGLHCGVVPESRAVHDRSSRYMTRDKRLELKCIAAVVKVSNPSRSFGWMRFREAMELIGMGFKNHSLVPWRFIREFRSRLPELKEYRDASLQQGAFLAE